MNYLYLYIFNILHYNLGILFILNMQRDQVSVTSIKDLSGLYSQPLTAGCVQ